MKSFSEFQRKHIKGADSKLVVVDGDPDFSLEHNERVVRETIAKNERLMREKKREYDEGIKERSWAAGQFINDLKQGNSESNVNKYFGSKYLAYLRGKEVMEQLKSLYGKKEDQSTS